MATTLKQFLGDKPRLEIATQNLRFLPKLRRLVAEEMVKLAPATSKSDLADKVLKEVTKPQNMRFLFGDKFSLEKKYEKYFIFDHLELPINLACETFTGVPNKSTYEANLTWERSVNKCKTKKHAGGNFFVHLSNQEDKNRVYVNDPTIEVSIVDNISPSLLLDASVEDRHKHNIPRGATFIKLNDMEVLYLFHSYQDEMQKRYVLPFEKVKQFAFKPLHEGFIQSGLQIIPRELDGNEFDLNGHGDRVSQKRYLGNAPEVYVFDQCWRGRMGKSTQMETAA